MSGRDSSVGSSRTSRLRLFTRQFSVPISFIRRNNNRDLFESFIELIQSCFELFVYLLGPVLICLASSIIGLLMVTVYTTLLPLYSHYYATTNPNWYFMVYIHASMSVFFFGNVLFNYYCCIRTKNCNGTSSFDLVCRQMANATGFFDYPETPVETRQYQLEFEDKMRLRIKLRNARSRVERNNKNSKNNTNDTANTASISTATTKVVDNNSNSNIKNISNTGGNDGNNNNVVRQWMLIGPFEWGFCVKTNQPKPPRSHYDHVTKSLVLCLDHYCPWMFNTVGYFNYRYFVNFLLHVSVGMIYCAILSYEPFINLGTAKYRQQRDHNTGKDTKLRMYPLTPHKDENFCITLAFTICLAVGIAVTILSVFHLFLVFTAQTTIEFHGNFSNRKKAKSIGKVWKNPYNLGYKRNFQQVYGSSLHPILAILLPSTREPEFLPVPLQDDKGNRQLPGTNYKKIDCDDDDINHNHMDIIDHQQNMLLPSTLSESTSFSGNIPITRKNAADTAHQNPLDPSIIIGSNAV